MSILHPENINVAIPGYPVDKIVGIYTGSYDAGTDTTITTYTFLGSPYDVWYYKIPHSFTRPVLCEVLTSTDNVVYSNTDLFAMSDSSFIYIYSGQSIAPSGTIYYRLIASWIDNYDTTNPSIAPVLTNSSNLFFNTTDNSQKIYLQGVMTLNAPGTTNIAHGLSYAPNAKVFFESLTGEVWPLHAGGARDPLFFSDSQSDGYATIDTTVLAITADTIVNPTRYWYKIYLDR